MRYSSVLLLGAMLAAAVIPAGAATMRSPWPIHVTTCDPQLNPSLGYAPAYYPGVPFFWRDIYGYRYYQPPIARANPTLSIAYVNKTQKVMQKIDFGLVASGRLVAEVRDAGTFSPGVEIRHEFGLSPNVFPLQTGLPRCVPLRITYADGTTWRNPHLPALRRSIYRRP